MSYHKSGIIVKNKMIFKKKLINVLPCSDEKIAASVSSILAEDVVSMGQVK